MSETIWHRIEDEPIPNTVFDVVAKYWDPSMDRFMMRRFADCVQVGGVVLWGNPFVIWGYPESKPIKLTDHGFRPTHWAFTPMGPE